MRVGLSRNVTKVGEALWKALGTQRTSLESLTLRTLAFNVPKQVPQGWGLQSNRLPTFLPAVSFT